MENQGKQADAGMESDASSDYLEPTKSFNTLPSLPPPQKSRKAVGKRCQSMKEAEKQEVDTTVAALKKVGEGLLAKVVHAKERVTCTYGKIKRGEPVTITLDQIIKALFGSFLVSQLVLVKLIQPSSFWLSTSAMAGLALGLVAAGLYYYNLKRKSEINSVVGSKVGVKGLQYMLGGTPAWLSITEHEKVMWLNSIVAQAWPFFDKGASKMIKAIADDIFESTLKTMNVPGIDGIKFHQLTFGDAPLLIDSFRVDDKERDAVTLEMDVRWCGEANIALAIDVSFGDELIPKVTDIVFVGSLVVTLKPLLDDIPGFGLAMISLKRPPIMNYNLNFGRLGGPVIGKAVTPVVDYILQNVIVSMLVAPQKFSFAVVQSDQMQAELDRLATHVTGVMKVHVISARGLKAVDIGGSSDPFTELSSDGATFLKTSRRTNTLEPQWGETFWLPIQDPHKQSLQFVLFDHDSFSAKEFFKLNTSEAFGAKTFLGRADVPIKPITTQEGREKTERHYLGSKSMMADGVLPSAKKNAGSILTTCTYRSAAGFRATEMMEAQKGIVSIKIMRGHNLAQGSQATVVVRARLAGTVRETQPLTAAATHIWNNRNTLTFYDVSRTLVTSIEVWEQSTKRELGRVELAVADVAQAHDTCIFNDLPQAGHMNSKLRLQSGLPGDPQHLSIIAQFIPLF